MSKKTPKPTPKPRRLSKKAIILITIPLLIFVILPLSIFAYIKLLDYQDAQKFQSLKADMLTLQTEFNKIMPGWEYEEGCWGGGGPYDRSQVQGCNIWLTNEQVSSRDVGLVLIEAAKNTMNLQAYEQENTSLQEDSEGSGGFQRLVSARDSSVVCSFSVDTVSTSKEKAILVCGSDARSFYFRQTN